MRIGLTYWSGEGSPIIEKYIAQNSKFFDKLFIISNYKFKYLPNNVKVIEMTDEEMQLKSIGRTLDLLPGSLSDLPFLFARKLLNYEYEKVMYFDCNTILTNNYLINQVFQFSELDKLSIKYSKGARYINEYKDYLSGDFSLDTKTEDTDSKVLAILIPYIDSSDLNYTCLGPHLLNNHLLDQFTAITSIKLEEISYEEVCPGITEFIIPKSSLGLGLSNTLSKLAKLTAEDFMVYYNKVFIKLISQ